LLNLVCEKKENKKPRIFTMRQRRTAQLSIFDNYAKHEIADQLRELSAILDETPEVLTLIEKDLIDEKLNPTGRCGLSVESIFRCMLLKQQLQVSYEQLAFHLCDSMSYRTFARIDYGLTPKKSSLQALIRRIRPETFEQAHRLLLKKWLGDGDVSLERIRIDSTVVKSDIAPPSDSQLLNDSVRVLSRYLAKSRKMTGINIRFTDKRKSANSLAFRIFNAKNKEKEYLYPELLKITQDVFKQVDRALSRVEIEGNHTQKTAQWMDEIKHYNSIAMRVYDQTERRVVHGEKVPASEKVVSLFEEHTDIIVKGFRNTHYGHKVNLSSEISGFITHLSIEKGNPADSDLYLPVLQYHEACFNQLPSTTVSDGCYASQSNAQQAKKMGVKRRVFNKPVGLSFGDMGIKKKTFTTLKNFRAGIEGNISELKRAFGLSKAKWKGRDGFYAFVWASTLCYNLVRMARLRLAE
jgi:IS5 family transposase